MLCRSRSYKNGTSPRRIEKVVVQSNYRIVGPNRKVWVLTHTAGTDIVHTSVGVNAVKVNVSELLSKCWREQLIASVGAAVGVAEIACCLHLLPSLIRDHGMGMQVVDSSHLVPVRVGYRVPCLWTKTKKKKTSRLVNTILVTQLKDVP